MINLFKLIVFLLFFSFSVYGEESLLEIRQAIDRINKDISDLQKDFYKNNDNKSSQNTKVTESSDITVFDMRLRDIEKELKTINLNYENLYFEIDKIKNTFEELSLKFNTFIINIEEKVDNSAMSLSDTEDSSIDTQASSIDTQVDYDSFDLDADA